MACDSGRQSGKLELSRAILGGLRARFTDQAAMPYHLLLVAELIRSRTPARLDELDERGWLSRRPPKAGESTASAPCRAIARHPFSRDGEVRLCSTVDQIAVAATDAGFSGTVRENAARLAHVGLPTYVPSEGP